MNQTLPTEQARAGARRPGAHLDAGGVRFTVTAPDADRVELVLVAADDTQHHRDLTRDADGSWSVYVEGIGTGQRYGYRVHGDNSNGQRFDPAVVLLDPYARLIAPGLGPGVGDLAMVAAELPPPVRLARPVPWSDTVLYELHVRGFTRRHPAVPDRLRGSYLGLAEPAVVDYLSGLGITSVELLPIHEFRTEPALAELGLTNYWGYNTLGYFAPHAGYASEPGRQREEFHAMVAALHAAGLEVLLDVVYNHTAEGFAQLPARSLRGFDQTGSYRLRPDGTDIDVTGCGNSVNTATPAIRQLIVNSLRHWVKAYGVDGFRFDLAPALIRAADSDETAGAIDRHHELLTTLRDDPVLRGVKLIAEPWDLGPDGYQLGSFPAGWAEWNDRYRDAVRDFWRGHGGGMAELAARLVGSPDLLGQHDRSGYSVNYVTCHDGFTLRDLVSYDHRHNGANREDGRDGSADNHSGNCGVEGPTDDPTVIERRQRRMASLLATMLVSAGVPMLTAGDECGRTQRGNNNAYCQDNELSWLDWELAAEFGWLQTLVRDLLALRRAFPALRRLPEPGAALDAVTWLGSDGRQFDPAAADIPGPRTLGILLPGDPHAHGDGDVLVWLNADPQPVRVRLPVPRTGYEVVLDSTGERVGDAIAEPELDVAGNSVLVLDARPPHDDH